jgi:hypothetical protein
MWIKYAFEGVAKWTGQFSFLVIVLIMKDVLIFVFYVQEDSKCMVVKKSYLRFLGLVFY